MGYFVTIIIIFTVLVYINFWHYLRVLAKTSFSKDEATERNSRGVKRGLMDMCVLTKHNHAYDISGYKIASMLDDYKSFFRSNSFGYASNVYVKFSTEDKLCTYNGTDLGCIDTVLFMKHCVIAVDGLDFNGRLYFDPNMKRLMTETNDGTYFSLRQQVAFPFMINEKLSRKSNIKYKTKGEKELCNVAHILLIGNDVEYNESKIEDYKEYFDESKYNCIVVRSVVEMMQKIEDIDNYYKDNGYKLDYETAISFFSKANLVDEKEFNNFIKYSQEFNGLNKEKYAQKELAEKIAIMQKYHTKEANHS